MGAAKASVPWRKGGDPVEWAMGYPFGAPSRSYLFKDGDSLPLSGPRAADGTTVSLHGRIAVLALGSNASPERLGEKFEGTGGQVAIPVLMAELRDFDVVHSAHFASYGSIPATIQHSPGTVSRVFVNFLTEAQLATMDASEALGRNYAHILLSGVEVGLEGGQVLREVRSYLSLGGCLALDGTAVSLAAVEASGRVFPEMEQRALLAAVRDLLEPAMPLHAFVGETIRDGEVRRRRTRALEKAAIPFSYTAYRVLGGTDDRA